LLKTLTCTTCDKGKTGSEPSQSNIRNLAMNAPQNGDIVAMMIALKDSGQTNTAVQLAKKQIATAEILFAIGYCLQ
jgi:NAD-dependent SIR2 family protein deacetylase